MMDDVVKSRTNYYQRIWTRFMIDHFTVFRKGHNFRHLSCSTLLSPLHYHFTYLEDFSWRFLLRYGNLQHQFRASRKEKHFRAINLLSQKTHFPIQCDSFRLILAQLPVEMLLIIVPGWTVVMIIFPLIEHFFSKLPEKSYSFSHLTSWVLERILH